MPNKPSFLVSPALYTTSARTSQSRVDQACAIEHSRRRRDAATSTAQIVLAVLAIVAVLVFSNI